MAVVSVMLMLAALPWVASSSSGDRISIQESTGFASSDNLLRNLFVPVTVVLLVQLADNVGTANESVLPPALSAMLLLCAATVFLVGIDAQAAIIRSVDLLLANALRSEPSLTGVGRNTRSTFVTQLHSAARFECCKLPQLSVR